MPIYLDGNNQESVFVEAAPHVIVACSAIWFVWTIVRVVAGIRTEGSQLGSIFGGLAIGLILWSIFFPDRYACF